MYVWRRGGVSEGGGVIWLDYTNWESRRKRGAAITCGSLLPESTSRLSCLFFIISQRQRAPGREASCALTTSHPDCVQYLKSPIFSLQNCCNSKEQMTALLFVLVAGFLTDRAEAPHIQQQAAPWERSLSSV